MEFAKYLKQGIWGLADKGLPVFYGLAYVVLVIRVLPEEEFGNFVLIQEIFLIVSALATGFALQPLLKFAAELNVEHRDVVGAAFLLNLVFIVLSSILIVLLSRPAGTLLNSRGLTPLMLYVPAMLGASFIRNFALILLQTRFLIKEIFWTDAAHFVGAPILIWIYSRMHLFDSALDLIVINVISLSASSLIGLVCARSLLTLSLSPRMEEMRKMWNYGKYSLGGIVSYLVYTKADTFILSGVSGPIQVAVYNSAKVFTRVFDMVSQIVQMFILPAASRLSSQGDSRSLKIMTEKSILFATVGMVPVFVLFLVAPAPLINILYSGRYSDAIPILQVFSLLTFVVPMLAVGSSILMGLGEARLGFIIGLEMLGVSVAAYFVFIPWLGGLGAATGFVVASLITAWLTGAGMNRFVPVTFREVLRRTNDIKAFVRSRLGSG